MWQVLELIVWILPVQIVKPDGALVPVGEPYKEDGIGTYVVDALGTVTFTPEKSWDGTTKAKGIVLRATDQNELKNVNDGTEWGYLINGVKTMDAVYVPNVIPVVPVGSPATTTNVQGAKQTSQVNFAEGSKKVPMNTATLAFATNDDGTLKDQPTGATLSADGKTLTVPGEGATSEIYDGR